MTHQAEIEYIKANLAEKVDNGWSIQIDTSSLKTHPILHTGEHIATIVMSKKEVEIDFLLYFSKFSDFGEDISYYHSFASESLTQSAIKPSDYYVYKENYFVFLPMYMNIISLDYQELFQQVFKR